MRMLLCGIVAACSAWAQTNGSIEGPVLGMVFDSSAGALRLIGGIPGSATLGTAVESLGGLAADTSRSYALVIGRDRNVWIASSTGARELGTSATRVLISPTGSAAALVIDGTENTRIFTGMPDAPRQAGAIAAEAVAVSDDGAVILSVIRNRRSGDAVYAHRSDGAYLLYRGRRVSAVAFVPGTAKAAIADSGEIHIVSPDLGIERAGHGIDANWLAVSADGTKAVAASRSGRITVVDLRSGASVSVACPCAPSTLAPLRGNAVFLLNEAGSGPVWVIDADSTAPQVYFVASSGDGQ